MKPGPLPTGTCTDKVCSVTGISQDSRKKKVNGNYVVDSSNKLLSLKILFFRVEKY
jgi:hypothetical protein